MSKNEIKTKEYRGDKKLLEIIDKDKLKETGKFVLNKDIAKYYHLKEYKNKEGKKEQRLVTNLSVKFQKVFACTQAAFFLITSSAAGYAAFTTDKDKFNEMMRTPQITFEQEENILNKPIPELIEEYIRLKEERNETKRKNREEIGRKIEDQFNAIKQAKEDKEKLKTK